MGNIFCCCLGVDGRRRRSNVPPMATETTPLHPHPPKFPVNRSVSAAATSSPDLCPHQYHSPPVTMPPPPYVVDEKAAVTVRSDTNLKKETLTLEPDPVNPTRLTRVVFSWRSRLMHSSPEGFKLFEPRNMTVLPCRHMCMFGGCAMELKVSDKFVSSLQTTCREAFED